MISACRTSSPTWHFKQCSILRTCSSCYLVHTADSGCVCRLPLTGVIKMECIHSTEKHFKHLIDDQRLQNFIANLARSRMSDTERLTLVSIFAPYHYFTCQQGHDILVNFGMGTEKVQAALLLNFRSAFLLLLVLIACCSTFLLLLVIAATGCCSFATAAAVDAGRYLLNFCCCC